MRARTAIIAIYAVQAGCSFDALTFRPTSGADRTDAAVKAAAEDCTMPGDEDGNGLADCTDPVCAVEYCITSAGCAERYTDRIAFMSKSADKWFGGDDRPAFMRSIGTGQGITPVDTVVMARFGFLLDGGFRFSTTGQFGSQLNILQLDRRDIDGDIAATYLTTLPPTFPGGWVYWNTPPTTLDAGTTHIFTAFLTTAFDQKVNSGTYGDAAAGYPGGLGYSGEAHSGDLTAWSAWYVHEWDFLFRIQDRNSACIDAR